MPVARSQVVDVGFGASHLVEGHPACGKTIHGHYFTVSVTFEGDPPPGNWGEVLTPEKLALVIGIVRELSGRHLPDMIPAGYTTPNGVANYLLERLTIHGATKVEVHESDTQVTGVAAR